MMQYTRVLIAKVALRVASEDEVFWIDQCIKHGCGCAEDVEALQKLDKATPTPACIDSIDLIMMADENKMSSYDVDHLVSCERCAKIGNHIANMPNPQALVEVRSLAG